MLQTLVQALGGNRYPGRGLLLGCGADGRSALAAYFLTGRSVNSRNRVLVSEADGVRTRAFDPALLADPSLILYAPVRRLPGALVVSNGDHTETIAARLLAGGTAEAALDTRTFEPDVPHHTPRIAGVARASGASGSSR